MSKSQFLFLCVLTSLAGALGAFLASIYFSERSWREHQLWTKSKREYESQAPTQSVLLVYAGGIIEAARANDLAEIMEQSCLVLEAQIRLAAPDDDERFAVNIAAAKSALRRAQEEGSCL